MTRREANALTSGVYLLRWKNGEGESVASVGSDRTGKRWYAPANWIAGCPCFK